MPFIGLWSDRVGGDSLAELQAYQPEWMTLGSAAWNDAPSLFALLHRVKGVSFRETGGPGAKLRGFIGPEELADKQANFFDGLVRDVIAKKEQLYAHGPDEEHSDFEWAIDYEERWLKRIHERGYRGIGWHCSFGWNYHVLTGPQKARLQTHWNHLDLIGRHSYIGWMFNASPPREADLRDTVLAPVQWQRFPLEKWLATEGGYDFWSTGSGDPGYQGQGSPGWRATGLSEFDVANRILEVCAMLVDLGVAGYTIFAHRTQNDAEWSNFYPTVRMLNLWSTFSNIRLPEDNMPITKADLEASRLAIREEFLNVQRKLAEAKQNQSFTEQGAELESVFGIAGNGANVTDAQFEELAKKL